MQQTGNLTGHHIGVMLLAFLVLCATVTLPAFGDAGTPAIAGPEIEHVSDVGENVCPDDGLVMPLRRKGPANSPAVPAINPGFVTTSDAYPGCILHGPPAGNLPA